MRRVVAAALFVLFNSFLIAETPNFQWLGDLPGGANFSQPHAISADGRTVVGFSSSEVSINTSGLGEAFVWTESAGMIGLGDLTSGGEVDSTATGVSSDGSVVAGISEPAGRAQAFTWTTGSGMVGVDGFGNDYSRGLSLSDDGSTVVGYSKDTAFAWTETGGVVSIGVLAGARNPMSMALDVSGDGSVVVGRSNSSNTGYGEAFRWTEETGIVGIGDLPGGDFYSQANGVSADGNVIVGFSKGSPGNAFQAFRWTEETGMENISTIAGTSVANDVSDDGSIIVGRINSEAFVWDEVQGMRLLKDVFEADLDMDISNWVLDDAISISADGTRIVGYGYRLDLGYQREAWIATIPEPAGILLLGVGGLLLRKKR